MDTTKAQQKALEDALIAPENRLKIRKCNRRLSPTLKSNEPTIHVALDALKLTPFYNAFEVSADVLEIYMQEFWATVTKHHFSLRFKMNGKSHTVNVNNFRDMLKICPKLSGQKFEDPPFEEEIRSFIRDLGHTGEIKWEDLVYQVENKNSKKINDMYYPRFTKVIVDYFMAKDQAIPRRNKMFWHYARDDLMFTTIRSLKPTRLTVLMLLVKRLQNQNLQRRKLNLNHLPRQSLLKLLKEKRIKTSAKGVILAKKKQSETKSKGLTILSKVALTKAEQMKITLERSKTQQHNFHASGSGADKGTSVTPGVLDVPSYESEAEQISWKSSDEEDDDEVNMGNDNDDDANNQDDVGQEYDEQDDDNQDDDDQEHDGQDDEEQDDVNEQTDSDNDGDDFVHPKLSTHDEEDKEEEDSDLRVHTPSNYESTDDEESDEEIQYVPVTTISEPPLLSTTTLPPPPTPLITHLQQTPIPTPTTAPSSSLQDLLNFGSLFGLRDEAQAENADFINKLDDNIKKIINDQVKEQVKAQVSKILTKIEKIVNEQLEAEVLTHSSNESKTSHAVAANLSELELKKILIDKMESNKSIHRSDKQKNLYKALVDAYESDKLILDTYGETVSFKRRRDEEDKDEEPSAGSNQGSKRRRVEKNQSQPVHQRKRPPRQLASQPKGPNVIKTNPPTPDRDWNKTFPDAHRSVQPWLSTLAQMEDPRKSFNELIDIPLDFSAFMMNRLKVDTLILELLAGPTFELMKGSCKSLVELEYFFEEVYKATTDQLDWNNPEGQQYPHDLRKPLPLIPNSRGRHVIPFDHFINNDLAYLSGGVSSRTYTTSVTKTKAANYGHIKWIEDLVPNIMWSQVPGIYSRCLLQTQNHCCHKASNSKLTNLTVEECLDFNVSLRMFTRSIVIQRRVEDLQSSVESYQKKLNLTKPDTYRSNIKRREAYSAYSNPRGFIYQNKDKKNRLMRIDELHKLMIKVK
ncbi:hypothetical protein Tco_0001758 [Tanacetum coccineum]